jgi:UDP-N-acetylglucosamine diphosphorylase / glucose-1-phosphate thymidylyltransferase / UDP-N-acetylgalactosamine diphosphorylase / glucosamine-1-phosphate N-acetyltransferase / galactosamine-1-phosphate N-acetyltransferase
MPFFQANFFFDLERYENIELFNKNENIWNSLLNIKFFFEKKVFKAEKKKLPTNCFLENPEKIFIGENTIIEPNTYIKGPCFIGKNCQIRHGAYIRGNVITGDGCIIGHGTEIKNSILLNNVRASHFVYIGDSILGNDVNIGANATLANYRLDREEVSFSFQNNKINTGLKKFGSVIGDNTQIGCNTVLNPATFLGKNVICYACLNIGGYVFSNSIIKQAAKPLVKQLKSRDFKNELIASVKK